MSEVPAGRGEFAQGEAGVAPLQAIGGEAERIPVLAHQHGERLGFRPLMPERGRREEDVQVAEHRRAGAARLVGERLHATHRMVQARRRLERQRGVSAQGQEGEHSVGARNVRRLYPTGPDLGERPGVLHRVHHAGQLPSEGKLKVEIEG